MQQDKKQQDRKQINRFVVKSVGGQRRRVGVLVAELRDEHLKSPSGTSLGRGSVVKYGWSRAAINKGDKFCPEHAMELATERLNAGETVAIPPSFVNDMVEFEQRAQRYFKNADGFMKVPVQIQIN